MKNHLLFLLTSIPSLLTSIPQASVASTDKLLATIELSLQAYQQQRLNMDLPASSISLDHQQGLWITGQRSVWKWNFAGSKLFEINLVNDEAPTPDQRLKKIASWDGELLVASHRKIFKVSFDPLKVIEFRASDEEAKTPQTFGLQVQANRFFWLKSTGVWTMNKKEQILTKLYAHPHLKIGDKPAIDISQKKLWIIRKNKLLAYSYEQEKKKPEVLLEIKYPFTGIKISGPDLIVHTRHTVLVLDKSGVIQKTIPVEAKRKLVLADIHLGQHSYLFHDRFLEVHKTREMRSLYSKVKIGRVKRAGQMIARKNMLALILDGKPRVFQIEGQW